MNRRGFLQCLGAFAAASALPVPFAEAKVAKAPAWAKQVIRFSCGPLEAGNYTFSAQCFTFVNGAREWQGLFVCGVKALGGETVFEVPGTEKEKHLHPRIIKGGINVPLPAFRDGVVDFYHAQLERGAEVLPYIPTGDFK